MCENLLRQLQERIGILYLILAIGSTISPSASKNNTPWAKFLRLATNPGSLDLILTEKGLDFPYAWRGFLSTFWNNLYQDFMSTRNQLLTDKSHFVI